ILVPQETETFAAAARSAIYEVIRTRRDIRHFAPERAVADDVLGRILDAAHHAPSVGFSQPWGFVLVRDREQRTRIRASFLRCRAREAERFPSPRREQYLALQLEGIVDAPLNVCVTVD